MYENQILAILANMNQHLLNIENRGKQLNPALEHEWLDSQEVCNLLHISKRTLENYCVKGHIPYSKIVGKVFYRKIDINEVLKNNMVRKEARR